MRLATHIGDLPVVARDRTGRPVRFTFTNVRHVPSFDYTLLSVDQIWAEQRVDSRFGDVRALVLPSSDGPLHLPFTPGGKLPTLTLISDSFDRADASASGTAARAASSPPDPRSPPQDALPADHLPPELVIQALAALSADDSSAPFPSAPASTRALGFHRVGATSHLAQAPPGVLHQEDRGALPARRAFR